MKSGGDWEGGVPNRQGGAARVWSMRGGFLSSAYYADSRLADDFSNSVTVTAEA